MQLCAVCAVCAVWVVHLFIYRVALEDWYGIDGYSHKNCKTLFEK